MNLILPITFAITSADRSYYRIINSSIYKFVYVSQKFYHAMNIKH